MTQRKEIARLREAIAAVRQIYSKTAKQEFMEDFPWLEDFQRGFDRTPSNATLNKARWDFLDVFRNGGPRQVEAFLSWLKPHRMSLAAFECLLDAADLAGVRLPAFKRHRDYVEEVLGARSPRG